MLNTSNAPLALPEDLDDSSMKSSSIGSIPDQNHNVPPTKSPPSTNNNIMTLRKQYQPKEETFQTGRDNFSFCNPAFLIGVVYFCGAMFFLIGMNVKGLTLLQYPWVGNLLLQEYQALDFFRGVIILQIMWCAHFIRKCAQTLFLNRYHGKMTCVFFMCKLLYNIIFGFWIGWSVNFYLRYNIPKPIFMVPGVLLFFTGEVGNFYSHWLLRNTRLKPSGLVALSSSGYKRILPDAFLFNYLTYPQFVFEVISCIGFYITSHTVAAGAFTTATILYAILLAVISHFQMKKNYTFVQKKKKPGKNRSV